MAYKWLKSQHSPWQDAGVAAFNTSNFEGKGLVSYTKLITSLDSCFNISIVKGRKTKVTKSGFELRRDAAKHFVWYANGFADLLPVL